MNLVGRFVARVVVGFLGIISLMFLIAAMIEGSSAPAPEEVVRNIYQRCQSGEAAQTAAYYLGGPQKDAAMRESICQKITLAQQMQGWEIKSVQNLATETVIETLSYRDAVTKTGSRIITWRLVPKGRRWLVGEV